MMRSGLACAVLVSLIAGSGGRADLVERAVSFSQHGRTLRVTDVALNRGTVTASVSRTAYYVAGKQIGSRALRALRPGAVSSGSQALTIPKSVPAGSRVLRVCADAGARVRESNERNNCRAAGKRVVVGDVTPPRFAGLERATTCIPGPVGGGTRYSRYGLQWKPALDNHTPTSEIVYDIYEAQTTSGEDFLKPTYTTEPGATSFTTPLLPDNVAHYFVVRAVDEAGNRDANTVERLGTNLCV